jgi:hypothetical protein
MTKARIEVSLILWQVCTDEEANNPGRRVRKYVTREVTCR